MQHHKMRIFNTDFFFKLIFPTVLTILYNSYLKDSALQDNGFPDPGTFPDHSVLANTDIRTKLQHRNVRLLSISKYTAKQKIQIKPTCTRIYPKTGRDRSKINFNNKSSGLTCIKQIHIRKLELYCLFLGQFMFLQASSNFIG